MDKWIINYEDNTCNNQVWKTEEEYSKPSEAIEAFLKKHYWLLESDINSIEKEIW